MMANIVVILIIHRRIDSFSPFLKVQKEILPDFTHIEVSINEKEIPEFQDTLLKYLKKVLEISDFRFFKT